MLYKFIREHNWFEIKYYNSNMYVHIHKIKYDINMI